MRVRTTVNRGGNMLVAGTTGVVDIHHKTPAAIGHRNGVPHKGVLHVTWMDRKSWWHISMENIVIQEH
jgi:hypothetical protein